MGRRSVGMRLGMRDGGKSVKRQVLIVGGGASGLMAGICCAREGASVTILEHMDRVGKKILSTGNGRCNMTNLTMRPECYRSSQKQFPMKVLDRFSVWDTLTFFDELGIETKNRNGYIYPNSDQASSVLDALRMEIEHLGVRVVTNCQIQGLRAKGRRQFEAKTDVGTFQADRLILATGSRAMPVSGSDGSGYTLAKSFGHHIIKPLPALVQLRCEGKFFKQLAGVRCDAVLRIKNSQGRVIAADQGEIQLTDYGISGIPTFQVSRYASVALDQKEKVTAVLDFLPSKSMKEILPFLRNRAKLLSYRKAEDYLTGLLNKKLGTVILKLAGIPADLLVSQIRSAQLERLGHLLKEFEVPVTAANAFEQAQICCGGVDTREVHAETLESKLVPGLYLIGELLDVDGICGGYNLQWAWATGAIAGRCAGREEENMPRCEKTGPVKNKK